MFAADILRANQNKHALEKVREGFSLLVTNLLS